MRSLRLLCSACLCILCVGIAAARSPYWEQKVTLFDILPIHNEDIVFLGNSITDGGEWAELFDNAKIKNRGISGDVVSGVAERLHQVVDGKPAKIFLLIGVNDVSHNLKAEEILKQYASLVKRIRKETPDTKLYIQSVMPVDNSFGKYKNLIGRDGEIPKVNEGLKKIASENGATYIDLWPVLASPKGTLDKKYTNDGLHLTGAGYLAWINAIRSYVEE